MRQRFTRNLGLKNEPTRLYLKDYSLVRLSAETSWRFKSKLWTCSAVFPILFAWLTRQQRDLNTLWLLAPGWARAAQPEKLVTRARSLWGLSVHKICKNYVISLKTKLNFNVCKHSKCFLASADVKVEMEVKYNRLAHNSQQIIKLLNMLPQKRQIELY